VSTGRIFVRIAAYRDPECEWTVRDAFLKAADPDRIFVGVCWQYQPREDSPSFRLHGRHSQVRIARVPARGSRGPCWARHQTERLWRGEEYSLQVDSHSRFAPGWDRLLLEELAVCDSPKPVLSSSPAPYVPPDRLNLQATPTIRRAVGFDAKGDLRFRGECLARAPSRPLPGAFVAGALIFSSAQVLREVPYDPYLYFDQEEVAYSLRLFTHGWQVFSPSRVLAYHFYRQDETERGVRRPLHWEDFPDQPLQRRGLARLNHLTRYRTSSDPEVVRELEGFGLGEVRSLDEFEAYSGIDLRHKQVGERARRALFTGEDLGAGSVVPVAAAIPEAAAEPLRTDPDRDRAPGCLQPGDFVPWFTLAGPTGDVRALESCGGAWTALVFASDLSVARDQLRSAAGHADPRRPSPRTVVISAQPPPALPKAARELGLDLPVWCDPDREIHRLFGVDEPLHEQRALAVALLTPDLRLHGVWTGREAMAHLAREPAVSPPAAREGHAPVLTVADVLTPADCERLLAYYHRSERAPGRVGAGDAVAYVRANKVRTDCFVEGDTLRFIDERLSRRLFPEIEKVFGLEVTHREVYKLGCYRAAKGGFFFRHRDSLDPALAYRRCAVTINLNGAFEGGELCFPEYGGAGYRPRAGSAVVFPCTLMHEVAPLRRGERYVLVGFLFGEREARARAEALLAAGRSAGADDWRVATPRPWSWLAAAHGVAHG
jgi:predicted 2-oxoglutarate/Fe(II)-dependent dioxygenase YbiX/peroxiredoxin